MSHQSGGWLSSMSPLATPLAIVGILFTSGLYLLHVLSLFYSRYKLHKPVTRLSEYMGVSILKPLVGTDPSLHANLRSFFTLDYPKYELLFCVHDGNDEALLVVKQLMRQFPRVDARIFIGGESVGLNPKINNMMPAYRASEYPLILISDSGMYMRPEAVTDMEAVMLPGVALVTQTPFCKDRSGFGSELEQMYFGTSHARIYLAGNLLDFVCSTGMSSMIRKEALEECGGMGAFGDFLAEDYFFGKELMARGWKCGLASLPAMQNSGAVTPESFDARVARWMKLRFAMLPHIIVVEPMQDWVTSMAIISGSLYHLFGIPFLSTALVHTVFWIASDYTLFTNMSDRKPASFYSWIRTWLRRELFAPRSYINAVRFPDICWRKGTYRLEWGGRIKPVRIEDN